MSIKRTLIASIAVLAIATPGYAQNSEDTCQSERDALQQALAELPRLIRAHTDCVNEVGNDARTKPIKEKPDRGAYPIVERGDYYSYDENGNVTNPEAAVNRTLSTCEGYKDAVDSLENQIEHFLTVDLEACEEQNGL